MSLSINGLPASSMRWIAPWSGVWVAEVTIQGDADILPSGRVAIVSEEGFSLVGTVDPEFSGTFGQRRFVRVIGGADGWRKNVRAQHYHSDVGLTMQVLASTTAAEVTEIATVLVPSVVGVDYVRAAGPASQIFTDAGVDWWVGLDGVTRVGLRLPTLPPASLEVLDWDPAAGAVSFTSSVLVEPGTVLIDLRFGTRVVRSVEAMVSSGSVTGTLWVGEDTPNAGVVTELVDGLASLAREATRATFGRLYEYRVIAMSGDRVEVQAVHPVDGVPDILPASIWAGVSGYKAKLTPASRVLVGFVGGNPRKPYVAAYEPPEGDGWRPVELDLDAVLKLSIGAEALAVVLGADAGALPIARAPGVIAFANAVGSALTAAGSAASLTGITPVVGNTLGPILSGLGAAITTAATTLATACPSAKVVAS